MQAHEARREVRGGGDVESCSVQEACVDEFLKEEFDISKFRILDPQALQHPQVSIFHRHKYGAQVLQV